MRSPWLKDDLPAVPYQGRIINVKKARWNNYLKVTTGNILREKMNQTGIIFCAALE